MFKHPRVDETVSHPEITDAKKNVNRDDFR